MVKAKFIYREKTRQVLLRIYGSGAREIYGVKLSNETYTTYAHTNIILKELLEQGLITSNGRDRRKLISITRKGIQIANLLIEIDNLMGYDDGTQINNRRLK